MSRLSLLASQPKLALGALLTLLLAAAAVVGSGADFTASSANPSNTFAAGTLTIGNSKDGIAVLTASNMRPGNSQTGTVDIQNTGSLAGTFTLSRTTPVDSSPANPLSSKLNVTVRDCGLWSGGSAPTCGDGDDAVKYTNGTLAQMGGAGHLVSSLGNFNGNDKRRYEFTVTLDPSTGNAFQGGSSTVEFDFNAA